MKSDLRQVESHTRKVERFLESFGSSAGDYLGQPPDDNAVLQLSTDLYEAVNNLHTATLYIHELNVKDREELISQYQRLQSAVEELDRRGVEYGLRSSIQNTINNTIRNRLYPKALDKKLDQTPTADNKSRHPYTKRPETERTKYIQEAKESLEKLRSLVESEQDDEDYDPFELRAAFTGHYTLLEVLAANANEDMNPEDLLHMYTDSQALLHQMSEKHEKYRATGFKKSDFASATRKLAEYRNFMKCAEEQEPIYDKPPAEELPQDQVSRNISLSEMLASLFVHKKPETDQETRQRTDKKLVEVRSAMQALKNKINQGGVSLDDVRKFYDDHYITLANGIRSGEYVDGKVLKEARSLLEQVFEGYDNAFRKQVLDWRSKKLEEEDRKKIDEEKFALIDITNREGFGYSRRSRLTRYVSELENLLKPQIIPRRELNNYKAGYLALTTLGTLIAGTALVYHITHTKPNIPAPKDNKPAARKIVEKPPELQTMQHIRTHGLYTVEKLPNTSTGLTEVNDRILDRAEDMYGTIFTPEQRRLGREFLSKFNSRNTWTRLLYVNDFTGRSSTPKELHERGSIKAYKPEALASSPWIVGMSKIEAPKQTEKPYRIIEMAKTLGNKVVQTYDGLKRGIANWFSKKAA